MKLTTIALGLIALGAVELVASGSWMKQVSGVGRSGDRQTAEKYARQNLKQEIDDLVDLCRRQTGRPKPEEFTGGGCRQYPLNWQCSAAGRVTCHF